MMNDKTKEVLIWLVVLLPFLYCMYVWDQLPDRVPTHWGMDGQVDDYSSKAFGLLMMPVINVISAVILFFVPSIDPRRQNLELIGTKFQSLRLAIAFFISVLFYLIVQAMKGTPHILNTVFVTIFLLFAFLGNYMRALRPNYFVGIRTPWTLENPEVWKQTHAVGGRMWFYLSLLMVPVAYFTPEENLGWVVVPAFVVIALSPVVYSYFAYKRIGNPKQ